MAKRKLSQSQRLSIRKDLSKLLRTSKTQAEALRSVAQKYGITTITARWYAKTLKTQSKARPVVKSGAAHRVRRVMIDNVVAAVQSAAEKAFVRARLAKKLIPQWQLYVRKEKSLLMVERKVRQELSRVSKKAKMLHLKIKGLTS